MELKTCFDATSEFTSDKSSLDNLGRLSVTSQTFPSSRVKYNNTAQRKFFLSFIDGKDEAPVTKSCFQDFAGN
jgi:hypothetical protein